MTGAAASAIPNIDMAALLADPEVQKAAPKAPLEEALENVTPADAAATKRADAKFEFRSLLNEEQLTALKKAAPDVAERMLKDYNVLLNFGAPVMEKMNQASIALLNEQKDIRVPEADQIVNNLLRELDGYNAKYRNIKMEEFGAKILKFFRGGAYTIKTMIRDAKPIAARLDEAELKIREMEINLGQNALRARKLHDQTLETMDDVVAVLAALEEILDYLVAKAARVQEALDNAAGKDQVIELDGVKYSPTSLKEHAEDLKQGITEVEKSWADWRAQFFLGFATAPTLRNLILVSVSMQRRLLVFRTQGIPSARRGLAMWQQAALAKQGAELGTSVQNATNKMISNSFEAAAEAVDQVAHAAQAPVITEDTVFAIIDSVKRQANSLVEADRWGRAERAKNLAAFERAEKDITQLNDESRRKVLENAMAAASEESLKAGPSMPQGDILADLGVQG